LEELDHRRFPEANCFFKRKPWGQNKYYCFYF